MEEKFPLKMAETLTVSVEKPLVSSRKLLSSKPKRPKKAVNEEMSDMIEFQQFKEKIKSKLQTKETEARIAQIEEVQEQLDS
jgi:hypothetical protein